MDTPGARKRGACSPPHGLRKVNSMTPARVQPPLGRGTLIGEGHHYMFHNVFVLLGILAAIAGFSLAFLSQRYWFARAWRFAGRVQRPSWRTGMRAALLTLLAMIALIAI